MTRRPPLNNRQRAAAAARERMDPVLYIKTPRLDGRRNSVPLRYLCPDERTQFLAKAISPLDT